MKTVPPLQLSKLQPPVVEPAMRATVDVHAHVMDGRGSGVPGAAYQPFVASVDDYVAHLDSIGMQRGVLVTPSAYGQDNSVLVEALQRHPDRFRGVAVVAPEVSGETLQSLHDAGVRGVRVQDRFAGGVGIDALPKLLERITPMGWHAEVWTDIREHVDVLKQAAKLGTVLIDHLGFVPAPEEGAADPAIPVLEELLDAGDTWVTLSGGYRMAPGETDAASAAKLAPRVEAVLTAAPDRVVWGSDWPYVAPPGPLPNAGDHDAVIDAWLPDEATRQKVLVENPARLYWGADETVK